MQEVTKASVLSNHLRVEPSRIAGDRTVTLAMPNKALSPSWGKCGRRERESRREGRRAQSLRVPFLRVSWRQKASRFSGRRHASRCAVGMETLVGSRSVSAASSAGNVRAGDSGCPKVAEEGNDVVLRHLRVGTGRRHGTPSHANRDASFARSFDPCSSILTMHRTRQLDGGGALLKTSRPGKLG
jgi:hypothetical protein